MDAGMPESPFVSMRYRVWAYFPTMYAICTSISLFRMDINGCWVPKGLALFYCRTDWLDRLKLYQYGWHMLENAGNYDIREWKVAKTAERFECGSPNMLGIFALSASIELLLEYGIENIERDVLEKSLILFNLINARDDLECLTNQDEGRFAGIVTFKSSAMDSVVLYRHLMDKRVICANRGGGVRFSPHFYTPEEKLVQAISMVPVPA